MVSALKGLQEKIRKLELERADAEDNLKKLAAESRHYKDVLQKELTTRESTQGVIAKQNKRKGNKIIIIIIVILAYLRMFFAILGSMVDKQCQKRTLMHLKPIF